ncbi:MAG: hypothetical protein KGQ87_03815 [Verrucomicrobia bacterium]|nr:hypothetical protein [Verrucomicrobiota bacterium]
MTEQQSTLRLVLYVLIAVVSAGSAGLATINFSDAKQVLGFGLGLLGTALTTARSYIDQSEKQVYPDEL